MESRESSYRHDRHLPAPDRKHDEEKHLRELAVGEQACLSPRFSVTLRYAHFVPSHPHEAVEKLGVAASVVALAQAAQNAARTIN
ncbi:MAG TPA: hypothetical protein VK728_09630 [Candidatus Sulfotelmatobacter sp.]|nr:hypothetical protein [Candidatus Sulfotelmatobacter sp.]